MPIVLTGLFALFSMTHAFAAEAESPAKRAPASELNDIPNAEGRANVTSLVMKSERGCYVLQFNQNPGESLTCSGKVPTEYVKRDCETGAKKEKGTVEAVVSCPDSKHYALSFRTQDDVVTARLRVRRKTQGKAGIVTRYIVEDAKSEEAPAGKDLPEPVVKNDISVPEESPLKFKFSGFASVEFEKAVDFGNSLAFDRTQDLTRQSNTNFMSNFNFEISRDNSMVASTLQIGEVYFGDQSTGGQLAAKSAIVLVRNLYLGHDFNERLGVRGGIISLASDPRSFIFSDNVSAVQASYKTDLSEGTFWYGAAARNQPYAPKYHDEFAGFQGTLGFLSSLKATAFAVYNWRNDESLAVDPTNSGTYSLENATSRNAWYGANFSYDRWDPVSLDLTAIGSHSKSEFEGQAHAFSSYLADAKLSFQWRAPNLGFTLEGLATPGSPDSVDAATGGEKIDQRRHFVSPVGASYLMTLATSDGADDAPGGQKGVLVASLSQPEGLRMGIASMTWTLGRKLSGFFRYGNIRTQYASATGSDRYGDEFDFEGVYQLSPSTLLQGDYGIFRPGEFFTGPRNVAQLFTMKMRFNF